MRDIVVQLIRRFVPTAAQLGEWEFLGSAESGKAVGWHELVNLRTAVRKSSTGAAG